MQDRVVTQPQPTPSTPAAGPPLASQAPSRSSPGGDAPASEQSSGAELQGEGNYDAARRHRESVEEFVESGQVESAARNAAPRNEAEAEEMHAAEQAGQSHAKGEDPALQRARDRQG